MSLFGWIYTIVVAGLLGSFAYGTWTFWKAWDVSFNSAKAQENDRTIDFRKAREQQYTVFGLGLPLGLIVVGLLAWHLLGSFTLTTYTVIAIVWFVTAPVRQLWTLLVAWCLRRRLNQEHALRANEDPWNVDYWALVRGYYGTGTQTRRGQQAARRRVFVGRLRWLNKVSWLWRWMAYLRYTGPVVGLAALSVIWPITAAITAGEHTLSARKPDDLLLPWWRFDRHLPPVSVA